MEAFALRLASGPLALAPLSVVPGTQHLQPELSPSPSPHLARGEDPRQLWSPRPKLRVAESHGSRVPLSRKTEGQMG